MAKGAEAVARTVDVRGELCPRPIIETARAMREVEIGDIVLVISTDRGIESDMPAWCKATGQELLGLAHSGDVIEAWVRRLR